MISDLNDLDLLQLGAEDRPPGAQVPNYEGEFVHAKSFLQKGSTLTGENL